MAMVLLYQNFYDSLMRIADMHTRERYASEDVLQEVFTNIWKRHKEIASQGDEPLQNYLIRAVQYHAITYHRRRWRNRRGEMEYYYSHAEPMSEYPAEADLISEDGRRFIKLILGTFPPRERQCLTMQTYDGMTVAEIATCLGISGKAVERSLTSARKRLRRFSGLIS